MKVTAEDYDYDCIVDQPQPQSDEKDILAEFINQLLDTQVNYVGIYKPGDFAVNTYRVILPRPINTNNNTNTKKTKSDTKKRIKQDKRGSGRGRGYQGCREDVVLETTDRNDIDHLIRIIEDLVNRPNGPIAVRHIVNPSQNKDEGVRIIWSKDLEVGNGGELEISDWERRDELIKSGKTVQSPLENLQFQFRPIASTTDYWGVSEGEISPLIMTPTSPNHHFPYQYGYGYRYEYEYGYPTNQQVEQQNQEGWIRFDGEETTGKTPGPGWTTINE